MEGVPRMPMLEIELKHNSLDYSSLDWAGIPSDDAHEVVQTQLTEALKKHIQTEYGDDPEKYNNSIEKLLEVQSAAYKAILSPDFEGCNALKKYYGQLHYMQTRFPFSGDDGLKVTLSWQDAFTGILTVHETIAFEQTAILFNIGAMHSILGASDTRMTEEGIRISCVHFQCAAGLFTYIADHFDTTLSTDISQMILKLFINVMLAQGQECLLEKSMQDNRKHSIVSKISQQVVEYYILCLQSLENRETENVLSSAYKSWKRMVNFKVSYYSAITKYFTGNNALEQDKYGHSVAYFDAAVAHLNDLPKIVKSFSKETRAAVSEALKFTSDVLNGKYNSSVKDNNFVYHDKVPDAATLPEVKGASLVKALPFEPANEQLTGPDIFAKLVPMEAHLAASTYSEEKAKLLRSVVEKVDAKNQTLVQYKSSIELDPGKLINPNESATLDQTLIEKCAQYNVDQTPISDLKEATDGLTETFNELEGVLEDIITAVENEETEDVRLKDAAGKDAFSTEEDVEGIKKELGVYKELQVKASRLNEDLQTACRLHVQNMKIVTEGMDSVKEELKLTDIAQLITEEDRGDIDLVRKLCDKVVEMEEQRASLMSQLRQQMDSDDVTSTLVTKHGIDQENLFEEELKKYDSLIDTVNKNLAAQDNILNAVTEANARYTNIRKAVEREKERVAQRTSTLIESCECVPTMLEKCKNGKKFFGDVVRQATSLYERSKEFFDENEEKRKIIYKKIEEKKKPPPRPSAPKPKLGAPKKQSSLPTAGPTGPLPPGEVLSADVLAKMMTEDDDEFLNDPEFLQFLQNQGDLQSMQLASSVPGFAGQSRAPGLSGFVQRPQVAPQSTYAPSAQSPAYPAVSLSSGEAYSYRAPNVLPRPSPQPTPPHISQPSVVPPSGHPGHPSYPEEQAAPHLPTSARNYQQQPTPGQYQQPRTMPPQQSGVALLPMPQNMPLSQPAVAMPQAVAHTPQGSVAGMSHTAQGAPSVSAMNQSMAASLQQTPMSQGIMTMPQYVAMAQPMQNHEVAVPTGQYIAPAMSVYHNASRPVASVTQSMSPMPYQGSAPRETRPQGLSTYMTQFPQSGAAVSQQMVPRMMPLGMTPMPPQVATSAYVSVPQSIQQGYHNSQQVMAPPQSQSSMRAPQVAVVVPRQSVANSYPQRISHPVTGIPGSNVAALYSQSDTTVHIKHQHRSPTGYSPALAHQVGSNRQQMGQGQLQRPDPSQMRFPHQDSQPVYPQTHTVAEAPTLAQYHSRPENIQPAMPQRQHVPSHPQQYYQAQTQFQSGVIQQPAPSLPHAPVPGQPITRPPVPLPQQTVIQPGCGMPRQVNPQQFQSVSAPQQQSVNQPGCGMPRQVNPQQFQNVSAPQQQSVNQPGCGMPRQVNPQQFQSVSAPHQQTVNQPGCGMPRQVNLQQFQSLSAPHQQTVNQPGCGMPRQVNPQQFQSVSAPRQQTVNQPGCGMPRQVNPQQFQSVSAPRQQTVNQPSCGMPRQVNSQQFQSVSAPQQFDQQAPVASLPMMQGAGTPQFSNAQGYPRFSGPPPTSMAQHAGSSLEQTGILQSSAVPPQAAPQGAHHLQGSQKSYSGHSSPANQLAGHNGPPQGPNVSYQIQARHAGPQPVHSAVISQHYEQPVSQGVVKQVVSTVPAHMPALNTQSQWSQPSFQQNASSMPQMSAPSTIPQMSSSMPQLSGPNLQGSPHPQPTGPQVVSTPQQPAPNYESKQTTFVSVSKTHQQENFSPQLRYNHQPAPALQANYTFKSQPHPGKFTSTPSNESSPKHVPKDVTPGNVSMHTNVLTPTPVAAAVQQPPKPALSKQPSSDLAGLILTPTRSLTSSADEMLLSGLDQGTNLTKNTTQVVLVPTKIDEASDTMVVRPVEGLPYMDEADLMKFKAEVEKLRSKVTDLLLKPSNHGLCNLDKEWKQLSDAQEKHSRQLSMAIARCSSYKNRFQDVLPFDQSRVVLKQAKDDYINASIIDSVSPYCPRFIATQSPLVNTVCDFWTMVYEQQVNLIVMLVNSKDIPRKCPMYWPADRTVPQQHGPLTVSFTTSKTHGDLYVERTFTVKHKNQSLAMSVIQLQYIAWPEHRFPSSASDLLSFMHVVQGYHSSQRNLQWPVLVHCESGVGRTGVFCAFMAGVSEINSGSGVMDVVDIVTKMRQKRKYTIQEKAQLKFVYDVILFHAIDVLKQRNVVLSDEVKAAPASSQPVNNPHPVNPNPKSREFDIFSDQSALLSIQATVEKMTVKAGPEKGAAQEVFCPQNRIESKSCSDIPSHPADLQPTGAPAVRPNTSETHRGPAAPRPMDNEALVKLGDLSDLVQGTIANAPVVSDPAVQTSPKPDVVESCHDAAKAAQLARPVTPHGDTAVPSLNLVESLTPEAFTLNTDDDDGGKRRQKITKEDFYKPGPGLGTEKDPSDPFSALDPLWGMKK